MRRQVSYPAHQPSASPWLRIVGRNLSLIVYLILAATGMVATYLFFTPRDGQVEGSVLVASDLTGLSAPIVKTVVSRPVEQRLPQSPGPLRIGIIAGHMGNDSGAVCADGLTEAEVNKNIAEQVASVLLSEGIRTEILAEFDPRLDGYSATALVSIHADSCEYVNDLATGFKISGSPFTDSSPLSICVEQAYRAATAMPYHPNSITPHMTNYHAFNKIAPGTQALIIEVGFLNLDREILTAESNRPAAGLIGGIRCFLENQR